MYNKDTNTWAKNPPTPDLFPRLTVLNSLQERTHETHLPVGMTSVDSVSTSSESVAKRMTLYLQS